jgi:hypothetical protein
MIMNDSLKLVLRRAAMTLLVVMMTMVNALTAGAYTVTLTAGAGTGADIVFDSEDPANMAESMNTAKGGQFWMEGEQLWFKAPEYPDFFTAPEGSSFDDWYPGKTIQVTENTVLTALWLSNTSYTFTLSPTEYTIKGSGYNDIECSLTSLDFGGEGVVSIFINGGTLTDGNGNSITFLIANWYYMEAGLQKEIRINKQKYSNISFSFCIYINPDEYNQAVPGTYYGNLLYNSLFSDNIVGTSGSIALTLTVSESGGTFYDISVTTDGHGTAQANRTAAKAGTEVALTATPDKDYFFKEWQVVSGDVTIADNRFTMPASPVEVKAVFEAVTVTFDPNGGTVTPTSMKTDNWKLTSLPTPTRDGWRFKGWYTAPEGGYLVGTSTEFRNNTTIYARWYVGSSYTLNVPDQVTITPNTVWTAATVGVSELTFAEEIGGKTPKRLRVVFEGGTLTNQDDHTKTIPFNLNIYKDASTVTNQKMLDYSAIGNQSLYIYIPGDNWNSAECGVYSGTISYYALWRYPDNTFSEYFGYGSFPVTVKIPRPYTITTAVSPAEGGTVTGGGTYDEGTDVTLQATANEGYRFVNWTEDGNEVCTEATYTFTLGTDRSLVANFERAYTISVMVDPEGSGTVTGGSSGLYADGTQLELKATANEGYRFVNWTIDGINGGSEPTYPFTVRGDFSTVVAHFERIYSLTGTNVYFYIDGDVVTEAAEGEQVTVSPNLDKLQDGYYLTGEYQSDDVEITKEDYSEDGCFTMPAKAVTVTAVTAPRTEYEIDLTTATEQVIDEEIWFALIQQDGYFGSTESLQYLDLNLDGTPDLQLTDDYNEATRMTTYGVTKLAGANQQTENYRLTIPTFSGLNPSRYSSILVKLVSGSGTHDLPQIIIGDVNGDGQVTITDATLLTDFVKTGVEPAGFIKAAADVDYSRSITMADVMAILEIILTSSSTID